MVKIGLYWYWIISGKVLFNQGVPQYPLLQATSGARVNILGQNDNPNSILIDQLRITFNYIVWTLIGMILMKRELY